MFDIQALRAKLLLRAHDLAEDLREHARTLVVLAVVVAAVVVSTLWAGGSPEGSSSRHAVRGDSPLGAPSSNDGTPITGRPAVAGTSSVTSVPVSATVVVHVAGAVVAPGLHELRAGARVDDAVRAAGGPAPDADLARLNLAAKVADGQRVDVPRQGASPPQAAPSSSMSPSGAPGAGGGIDGALVDLNQASEAQLEALPGVGPATAAAIVAFRDTNGPFRSVDDLASVKGIGPAKLAQIRPHATV